MSNLTSLLTKNNAKPKEKYGRLITVIDELFVEHTLIIFYYFHKLVNLPIYYETIYKTILLFQIMKINSNDLKISLRLLQL